MARRGTLAHKQARLAHLARYRSGVTVCAIGGEVLTQPARLLDLAHDHTDPTGATYLGLACRKHNRGPRDNPWGGRSYGRSGGKKPRRQLTRTEQRDRNRMTNIAAKDSKRRERLILPSTVNDDQDGRP